MRMRIWLKSSSFFRSFYCRSLLSFSCLLVICEGLGTVWCEDILEEIAANVRKSGDTFVPQASKQATLKVKKLSTSSVSGSSNAVTTYTGSSFRDFVFTRLCGNSSIKWPHHMVVPLLTTIRDLHPDEKELKMAVS